MSGALRIKVHARDGLAVAVEIDSPRVDPSAVFIGRTPEEAAVLASRLFSLCPSAQSIATRAATGLPSQPNETLALLCEKLTELLRASLLDWPGAAPAPDDIATLRDALSLLRRAPDAAALRDALARLAPFFARQHAEAAEDDDAMRLSPRRADFLTPDDDVLVIDALWSDRTFCRAPALPGRRVETGIAARRGLAHGGLAARVTARRAEMLDTVAAMTNLCDGGAAPDLVSRGAGYAAVDSARGRLYHACKLDASGRISDYRMVAPTEWNFHPDGPFARLIAGARIGAGADAKRRVERLAFAFDPCIKAEAEILELPHA
ncbi:Nickel-dependent hydrogenase [Rhodoblastus acidophilus]|uniref:Nickel-dependent hydrogenase n=2 Tax=Rhodoblastus acidophilus TaxID=1074 RepID=A0A212RXF7_RHOAC|nr:nickel-dependent hydrogenase large subunit [Rhodoblastus acidophilus]PPQ38413.1 hypothetical protein CKO16_10505 [Rhodoblastus acidophilus]SNB77336.1 Nickel-dependent hydrogenase [Rhodoblastus acidophilus]